MFNKHNAATRPPRIKAGMGSIPMPVSDQQRRRGGMRFFIPNPCWFFCDESHYQWTWRAWVWEKFLSFWNGTNSGIFPIVKRRFREFFPNIYPENKDYCRINKCISPLKSDEIIRGDDWHRYPRHESHSDLVQESVKVVLLTWKIRSLSRSTRQRSKLAKCVKSRRRFYFATELISLPSKRIRFWPSEYIRIRPNYKPLKLI